ncbi:MAG TPA: hypothetical protein VIK86_01160 [Candidatus Paceibacterota bacterium]
MDKKSFIICFGPESTHKISLEKLGEKYEVYTTSDISGVGVVFSKVVHSLGLGVIDLSLDVSRSLLEQYIPNCGFPVLFFSSDSNQKFFVKFLNKKYHQQELMFCTTSELDEKIESILG